MSAQKKAVKGILEKAASLDRKIVLPESWDFRTLKAAYILAEKRYCRPVLVGSKDGISAKLDSVGLTNKGIETIDPENRPELTANFADWLFEKRKHKGMTLARAQELIRQPVWFGAAMVRESLADGCLSGADTTTAEVVKSAIFQVGTRPGGIVSSCFLMILPSGRMVTYADCGVIPYPDSGQLAHIALDAAESHRKLTGEVPIVAMLSFSTKGSASHERVSLVAEALDKARQLNPDLSIDGEFQFDAAYVEEIGARKAPGSPVAGKANTFIFPNLDAGNIAYKITERIGGAVALGPVLQGLVKPVNDLSRGCSVDDIVQMAAITALKG